MIENKLNFLKKLISGNFTIFVNVWVVFRRYLLNFEKKILSHLNILCHLYKLTETMLSVKIRAILKKLSLFHEDKKNKKKIERTHHIKNNIFFTTLRI